METFSALLALCASKSKKTLFNVGQCKQYNISSHLKWVLVADKIDGWVNNREADDLNVKMNFPEWKSFSFIYPVDNKSSLVQVIVWYQNIKKKSYYLKQ